MPISSLLSYVNPFAYFGSNPPLVEDEELPEPLLVKEEELPKPHLVKEKELPKPLLVEYEEISELKWVLYGEEICIIRHGEELNYLVVDVFTKKKLRQSNINKNGHTADEVIDRLKRGIYPEVRADGSIDFLIGHRSMLDCDMLINKNHWGITMVDTCSSKRDDPYTWGGHAVLLIEKVENGKYIMLKAHLFSGKKAGIGEVQLEKITDFKYLEYIQEKTETWVRSAEKVQKMISSIEEEISKQQRGEIGSLITIGGGNIFNLSPKKIGNELYYPNNCFIWDKSKLELAGIKLPANNALFINTPKSNIDPTALASKASVYVVVTGIPFIEDPIDITESIHRSMLDKYSWQVLSSLRNDTCTINGRTYDNVVAKTTACLKRTVFNIILADVEQLHVCVKIRNEGIHYIDITKLIESYINSYLKSHNIPKDDLEGIPWDQDIDSKYDTDYTYDGWDDGGWGCED
ncbi:MAG: hypothetical protein KR126chlam6_01147 [Candidatus Anoxychlamydiales bacterium]|nr:hypothetical protein [Candidatus Anoxychlamydiales bacterium]